MKRIRTASVALAVLVAISMSVAPLPSYAQTKGAEGQSGQSSSASGSSTNYWPVLIPLAILAYILSGSGSSSSASSADSDSDYVYRYENQGAQRDDYKSDSSVGCIWGSREHQTCPN